MPTNILPFKSCETISLQNSQIPFAVRAYKVLGETFDAACNFHFYFAP